MLINDAILVQHAFTSRSISMVPPGIFHDMMRLTYQRHAAYTRAHNMDYWHLLSEELPELYPGGWGKVSFLRQAAQRHYEHIFWIDADAAIVDMDIDLREALPEGMTGGACIHDAPGIKKHLNIGVMYYRNTPELLPFLDEWLASYPGDKMWLEQGSFNVIYESGKYKLCPVDDKWNATINVNMVDKPAVYGWHGVNPIAARLGMMKQVFYQDHIKFLV